MQSTMDTEARLKAACFDYYTTQQLLVKAENEHLQLRSIAEQLKVRNSSLRSEVESLKEARVRIDEERSKESALPAGVPVAAFDAFVNEEQRLLAEAARANDILAEMSLESKQLEQDLIREGRSAALLEDALDAQVKFSEVLLATCKTGGAKIDSEHSKQATNYARLQKLSKELTEAEAKEAALKKALRACTSDKGRSQGLLQERDGDVMRLRRDAAFARRLHLGELEHAREQESELLRLTTENRRLRAMVDARRQGRPTMIKSETAPADQAKGQDQYRTQATVGAGAAARTVPCVVESNDELENFKAKKDSKSRGAALDQCRELNLALLQQMVATMQALRVAVEPSPTSRPH